MKTFWSVGLVVAGFVACSNGSADAVGADNEAPEAGSSIIGDASTDGSSSTTDDAASGDEDSGPCSACDGGSSGPLRHETKSCVAGVDGSSSLSTVTYDTDGLSFAISLFETLVKNKDQRNANSLVVALQKKGASTYQNVISSGPILTSGAKVSVPVPANFTVQSGDTLRVTTTFDEGKGFDPTGPCFMKF